MLKSLKLELTCAIVLLISTPAIAAPLENWNSDPNTNQSDLQIPGQAKLIAQASANDLGLPPAPPAINVAPDTPPSVTAPPVPSNPVPSNQSRPLPTTPAAGSNGKPGSSLLLPTAPARSTMQSNPLQLPEVNSSLEIPRSFPPVVAPTSQPTVTAPQLEQQTEPQRSTQRALENTPVPARSRVIEFGQPLPQ